MSLEDFCSLDFEEFEAIAKSYGEGGRDAWEIMRLQTTALLQPHAGKGRRLTPRKVFRYPWDGKTSTDSKDKPLTREERRSRMRELAAKLGDKVINE